MNYYVVEEICFLSNEKLRINEYFTQIVLIKISMNNVENPTIEPIGIFNHYGSRCYIWRDKFWMEYNLPRLSEEKTSELGSHPNFNELLELYYSSHTLTMIRHSSICRVLCEINDPR